MDKEKILALALEHIREGRSHSPAMDALVKLVRRESLHWMEWGIVLPRIRDALLPGGRLAILSKLFSPLPWDEALADLVARYTTNPDQESFDLVEELESRGLFRGEGEVTTAAAPLSQTVEDFVESCHSTSYLSRDRMAKEDADAFDSGVRELVKNAHPGGRFSSEVRALVAWGQIPAGV